VAVSRLSDGRHLNLTDFTEEIALQTKATA
jgi:hypothetical protein